ncbi:LysR substrate-binding domain-containing protein [Shimia haliotis]|uniref:LysR family transcriptional regulator, glycine cleavage system transcriptional activator n=1 Tax=Shimia haliotis TaxID=1280847 RepID=A0A1I4DSQ3_9RHOB|nr:LysR substrate-binding domain-containing protein [Shimia haliotis]SFK96662.1 LysR family transcriptional regulator, glycine cleavage system transcriptional activator [Shimia haliotis]
MSLPNLNALKMFDAAARHLNFRLASEELNLTQGAVAQQVRNLEESLKNKLFLRLARGLELTDSGARYHQEIRKALEIIDTATRDLRPAKGAVTLSLPPSLAAKWLVPRLASFADKHPEITLRTHASARRSDLRRDGIDLAIRQGPPPKDPSLHAQRLAPLDLIAVTSPAYLANHGAPKSLADFASHKLIEDSHAHWQTLFESDGMPRPEGLFTFNQTALAIDAATNGQGITIAPRLLVQDALSTGLLSVIWTPPASDHAFHILHPKTRQPERDTVIAWLLSEAQ